MAFLKLLILFLVALTVIYVSLLFYLRALRRDKLVEDYASEAGERERDAFVKAQLETYMSRLGPRLAAVVYGVPVTILVVIVYVTNFN